MSDNGNWSGNSRKTERKVYAPVSDNSPLHVETGYVDSRKGSGATFLWIILALLVCGAMVGGYYFFLRGDDVPAVVESIEDGDSEESEDYSRNEVSPVPQVVSSTAVPEVKEEPVVEQPAQVAVAAPVETPRQTTEVVVTESPADKEGTSASGGKQANQNVDKKGAVASGGADNTVYNYALVDEKPMFPGGEERMYQWLSQNITYPASAAEDGVQGRVVVSFTIEKDGSISDAKVVRGKHQALDKEALRLVKAMPRWTPGRANGQPVRVTYTLPITFRLQ